MPKLPDVGSMGERPAAQPARGTVGYDVPSGIEAPGRALAELGSLVGVTAVQWQEKADTTKIEDAWNKYKNAALDATSGENGVLQKKGGDAVNGNILQATGQTLGAARQAIESTLTNDDQRRRFAERAAVTDLQVKSQVLSHLASAHQEYAKTTMMASQSAAQAQIAAMPTSPDVFKQANDTLMQQADTFLNSQGIRDPLARDAYKAKVSDTLWKTRIDALLYKQPLLADALFRANHDQIQNVELRLQLQAQTREASTGVSAGIEAQKAIDETRAAIAPQRAAERATPEGGPDTGAMTDTGMRVDPATQLKRDRESLRIMQDELRDNPNDIALQKDIKNRQASIARLEAGGAAKVAMVGAGGALPQPTSGLPNARDVAAQLPVIMGGVEKAANRLYGSDQGNPDRAAFIRRMTGEVHAKLSADVQQLNAIERQAQGQLIDAIAGIAPSGGQGAAGAPGAVKTGATGAQAQKITSFGQIQADPQLFRAYQLLDYQGKIAVDNMIEKNIRAEDKGDVALYRNLWNRIHLEPGDPKKIEFYKQITDPAVANSLSIAQIGNLRQEIDRNETPGGRSLNQLRKNADTQVSLYFKTHPMFTAQPDRQIAATMQWNEDVGKSVDNYVKAGQPEKVRAMFQLGTPESVIDQKFLAGYINSTPAMGMASSAAAVKTGTAQPLAEASPMVQPKAIDTREKLDAWLQTLPPAVTSFVGTDGKTYKVPARAAPATPTLGAWVPNPADLRPDGTQKGAGFLGPLVRPDGKTSTEISISTDAVGKKDFPLLVPTLTKDELAEILAIPIDDPKFFDKVPPSAVAKAEAFAEARLKDGKPLFAAPGEQVAPPAPVMNEHGKLVTPTPPAAEQAITSDQFEISTKPTTVAGNIAAIRTARAKALQLRKEGAIGPQYEILGPVESIGAGMKVAGERAMAVPRAVGGAIARAIPTEMEAVTAGFEAIKKSRRISPADADILEQVILYGQLTPADEKLARNLLAKLEARK